jgi:hypothetical protein
MSTALYDPNEALYGANSPQLEPARISLLSEPELPQNPSPPVQSQSISRAATPKAHPPDLEHVFRVWAPENPELFCPAPSLLELPTSPGPAMTDHVEDAGARDALNHGGSFQRELSIRDQHGMLPFHSLV